MNNFFIDRIKSLKFALRGMVLLLQTEHAVISQFTISLFFIGLGFYFEITRIEWIIQLLLIGFVLAIESLNTAIEKICAFIYPDFHDRIGFIKDISASAVSFAVITTLILPQLFITLYF